MHASKWIYGKIIISFILLSDIGLSESSAQTRDCHFTLTRESGYFQTPDFPSKYPSNIECIWNIQVQPGHFILLSFDVFEIESYKGKCIDIVEVKDGNKSSDELLGVFCDTRLPPNVITSSTNSLRIWFFSDKSDAHQGFNASYKSQLEQGCGGLLSNTSGSISSPRFPDYPYPNSLECDWIITVPRGKFIRLQFSTDYEIEFNCDKKCKCVDYLELWDGPESNKTQIGSFCISIPPLIVSKSSRMRIRFVTNTEGRFKGFGLSYTTSMTPGCGGDIAGESGVIQSPNYPESFPTFSDCVWRIRAPADRYISFRFDEFSGINGTNSECSVNAIELREGYSREAQVLGRYCAQNVPPVIVTKGSDLFIHFQERNAGASSNSFTHRRFKGTYLTHSTDCNESIGLQDGRVRDSQLSASSYFSLKLGRGQLYMTPQYGRVGSAYSWCSQRQMLNKTVGEYFEIDLLNFTEITAIATQGYQLPSTIYWGYVSRYRVEYSYDGKHWISYRDNKEHSSNIGFTAFTGNKNVKDIRKNVLAPAIIAKKIRLLPTRFLSNPVQHMCLRAELYGCLFDRGCGGIISMERLGKISVRGIYGQSKLCRWLFIHSNSTSSNIIVNFHFTYFDVPCRHGYVTLHDRHGGKRKTYCGASPPIVPSLPASSQIALEIQLENSSDVWGFELKYRTESIGCGAILEISTDNKLVSPRYPLPYQHNQDCTWILLTSPGYKIAVRFIEFDLQPPYNKKCQDYVQIQNGRQDYSPVLGKFCGKHVPGQVISTFNKMRITFHSDNTTTAKGFVLQYSVIPPKRLPNTTFRQANVSPEQTEKPLTSSAATSASGQEKRERNKGHSRRASPCLLCLLPLLIIAIPEK